MCLVTFYIKLFLAKKVFVHMSFIYIELELFLYNEWNVEYFICKELEMPNKPQFIALRSH